MKDFFLNFAFSNSKRMLIKSVDIDKFSFKLKIMWHIMRQSATFKKKKYFS